MEIPEDLLSRAAVVRDAADDGENTAWRVGSLFVDIVTLLKEAAADLQASDTDFSAKLSALEVKLRQCVTQQSLTDALYSKADAAAVDAAFERLGILAFDRMVYAAAALSGAASGTVAFSIQEHIFVVAGSGGGVSPMSSYNATTAEGLPCPRTDRLYSCSGTLYVADPEDRLLVKTATLADTVQVMSEVSEVKLTVLDVSDRLETVEESGIPGLRSSIEDCARRIEAVGDSVGGLESRLVPEAMEVSAPERLTFGNTAEIYIGTRLLPDGVMHNVIYISDGKSVTVDHRGRLRIAGRGTSAVQVIPTCATSLARTVLITVSDPAMRLCAGGGPVRLTSSGSCRFS